MLEPVLFDRSSASIIQAIEDNQISLISTLRQWSRAEVHNDPGLFWTISDIPFPLFNSILRTQLPVDKIDSAIQSRIEEAKSRNVPLLWRVGPGSHPPDLKDHLEKYGFTLGDRSPGMAADLASLESDLPVPPGFSIRLVSDPDLLKCWNQVCGEGFEMPEFVVEAFNDLLADADPAQMRAYLGWLDGRAVATSLLVLGAGVAGIYNVTTISEARRKGIGAIMTAAPLQAARAEGYTTGVLEASEMGQGVYLALGFKEYCTIDRYLWQP